MIYKYFRFLIAVVCATISLQAATATAASTEELSAGKKPIDEQTLRTWVANDEVEEQINNLDDNGLIQVLEIMQQDNERKRKQAIQNLHVLQKERAAALEKQTKLMQQMNETLRQSTMSNLAFKVAGGAVLLVGAFFLGKYVESRAQMNQPN